MTKREIDLTDDELDALEVIIDAGRFMVIENYVNGNYPTADSSLEARREFRAAWQTSQLVDAIRDKFSDLRPAGADPLAEAVARLAEKDDPTYDEHCSLTSTPTEET